MIANENLNIEHKDMEFGASEFERISKFAKSGWGLNLDEAKQPLIRSRLSKRIKILNLPSFAAYCDRIESGDVSEQKYFVAALTTNVTHFYRERHHFDFLESEVLPDILLRAKAGERIRIWSAGCSSGKEPYSLAGSIFAVDANSAMYDIKILATDIDTNVLQDAQSGIYSIEDGKCPTDAHHARIFTNVIKDERVLMVRPELNKMIAFRELNLFSDWPMKGAFDIIMCRNVAIYFDKETQAVLWRKFCQYLRPQGHLMIGHSERVNNPEELDLLLCATTSYQFQSERRI